MSVATMSTIFAVLALLAGGGALLLVAARLGWFWSGARKVVRRFGLPLAWVVATLSTAGSLYYSEVAGYIPCELCWWQRIAMYPLSLILLIAMVRGDRTIRRYVGPLAVAGLGVSAYHYAIQTFPSLQGIVCAVDAPCTARWVEVYGFVSIPFMAMCGFALIAAIMWSFTKGASS